MAARDRGDPEQKRALWKFEAPSMTTNLLAGRKATETAWVKDTQTFVMMETLVFIYGLPPMKAVDKTKKALDHFELLAKQVVAPGEFRTSKLLVPLGTTNTEPLSGERIWAKAQGVKRDVKGDLYAGLWNKICPGNQMPSGKSLKDVFAVWWNYHYHVHNKKMKFSEVTASLAEKTPVEKAPPEWCGPLYAHVFEKFGLPAKHHPDSHFWTCDERALFDASDGVSELSTVEAKFASRAKQREEKREHNGYVALDKASKAAEVSADMTRARAEATYATSQLHTSRMSAWKEKIAALQEARKVCMEDAELAESLGDPDFNPRELRLAALRLGRELRSLSANPPSNAEPSAHAPVFQSPVSVLPCRSTSPRSTGSTHATTRRAPSTPPRTTTPLRSGTPEPDDSESEMHSDGDRHNTPLYNSTQTADINTARRLLELATPPKRKTASPAPSSGSSPPPEPEDFLADETQAETATATDPAEDNVSVRRSPRHTPSKPSRPAELPRADSTSEGGQFAAIQSGRVQLEKRPRKEGRYKQVAAGSYNNRA